LRYRDIVTKKGIELNYLESVPDYLQLAK